LPSAKPSHLHCLCFFACGKTVLPSLPALIRSYV
jgi:hypothetical protein